jgi:hypothetical protein
MTFLSVQMAKKKRVPLGQAIRWTEAEIDEFSQVTPGDIADVRLLWRKYASPKYRALIDAEEVEGKAERGITANS